MFGIKYTSTKNNKGLTEEQFLKNYNPDKYPKPSVTVDIVLFTAVNENNGDNEKSFEDNLKILMVKRADHPFISHWALPGGFVSIDESIDDAAQRELKEETNIDNIYMEQLHTWGNVGRDPRMRVISCSYMAFIDSSLLDVKAGDDAADARWFSISCRDMDMKETLLENGYTIERLIGLELKNEDMVITSKIKIIKSMKGNSEKTSRMVVENNGIAFDHGMIIQYAVEVLRKKAKDTI